MVMKSCRHCGTVTNAAICPPCGEAESKKRHAAREARRPSARKRGYDAEYEANRTKLVAATERAMQDGYMVRCVICKAPFIQGQKITAEHIIPRRYGGSNSYSNLGPAHSGCNTAWNKSR